MKQIFDLPDNASAQFFIGVLSSEVVPDQPYDDTRVVNDTYKNVTKIRYQHDTDAGVDAAQVFVAAIKARYLLPELCETYTTDPAVLAGLTDMTDLPQLEADSIATEIYLADNYKGTQTEYHDGDLVPVKHRADIVIKNFKAVSEATLQHLQPEHLGYQLYIDDELVMDRQSGEVGNGETAGIEANNAVQQWDDRNQQFSSRLPQVTLSDNDATLTIVTNDEFYQGSRVRVRQEGLPGAKVLLKRHHINGEGRTFLSTFRFVLPSTLPQARYDHYCGKGKDEASQWCRRQFKMKMDILEMFPDKGYINIVWRGHWSDDDVAVSQYRQLKLKFINPVIKNPLLTNNSEGEGTPWATQ
ncbi:MAG: hypothetical protein HRT35_34520 [Algicola sp.]|nr:hypothetical protein [Algicola sp.]